MLPPLATRPHLHSTQTNAYMLADMRINDAAHNETYELFWQTQPDMEEVFSPDMWKDHHFDKLQSKVLVCGMCVVYG